MVKKVAGRVPAKTAPARTAPRAAGSLPRKTPTAAAPPAESALDQRRRQRAAEAEAEAEPEAEGDVRYVPFSELPVQAVFHYNGSALKKVSNTHAADLIDPTDQMVSLVPGETMVEVRPDEPDTEDAADTFDPQPEDIDRANRQQLQSWADDYGVALPTGTVQRQREALAAALYPDAEPEPEPEPEPE